eukprot:scaffold75398_cov67-Phaeocystis_antarctica.AAC.3
MRDESGPQADVASRLSPSSPGSTTRLCALCGRKLTDKPSAERPTIAAPTRWQERTPVTSAAQYRGLASMQTPLQP